MSYFNYIKSKVLYGETATISLTLFESEILGTALDLGVIEGWVSDVCDELGCTASIHFPNDVITFYPATNKGH